MSNYLLDEAKACKEEAERNEQIAIVLDREADEMPDGYRRDRKRADAEFQRSAADHYRREADRLLAEAEDDGI